MPSSAKKEDEEDEKTDPVNTLVSTSSYGRIDGLSGVVGTTTVVNVVSNEVEDAESFEADEQIPMPSNESRLFGGSIMNRPDDDQPRTFYQREDGAALESYDDGILMMTDRDRQRRGWPSNSVLLLTLLTSLGGVLFGYDLGVIASALPGIADEFHLNNSSQEWVVAALYVGGGFGAALGGALCDTYGRRQSILGVDVAFVVGALLLATAAGLSQLVVGRIVVGFAVALSGLADVAYLSEIAPIEFRGALVSVNEACISLGFLLSFVAGTSLGSGAWRLLFGMSGAMALVQFVGMLLFMPESPVWLEKQGRFDEADAARRVVDPLAAPPRRSAAPNIGCDRSFDRERSAPASTRVPVYQTVGSADPNVHDGHGHVHGYGSASDADAAVTTGTHHQHHRVAFISYWLLDLGQQLVEFYRVASTRFIPQSVIALFLSAMQQLCGQTNVLSYANHLLEGPASNTDGESTYGSGRWAPLYIGIVKFAVTCIVIWRIENAGRRFFLLTGMGTISVGLVLLVLAFGAPSDDSSASSSFSGLVLPGMLLVVCGYSMSFGPLTWLLTSELFPAEVRGRALGCSTIVTYLCAAAVTSTFLSLQAVMGTSILFAIYLVVTVLGCGFAYAAIPETKEQSPEEIDQLLQHMPWWSDVNGSRRLSSSSLARQRDDDGSWDGPTIDDGQELPRLT